MSNNIMIGAYVTTKYHDKLLEASKKDNRTISSFIRSATKNKIINIIGEVDLNGN